MNDLGRTFTAMSAALDGLPHLHRLGTLFCECVLIEAGEQAVYLKFHRGRIEAIEAGANRRTPWRFALRTDAEALSKFWEPMPQAGFHDIFGLVKIGRATIEGDILVLVKNLRFFKEFMALGRELRA